MKKLIAVAMVAFCAVAQAETTGDYVQDGLIAMWDGWENDGSGGHATSLTEWKDTSGQYSFVFNENSGIKVEDNRLVLSGESGCYATLDATSSTKTFNLAKSGTLEVVFRAEKGLPSYSILLQGTSTSGIGVGSYNDVTRWLSSNKMKSPNAYFNAFEGIKTFVSHYSNGGGTNLFVDGVQPVITMSENLGGSGTVSVLGARASDKTLLFKGEIYAIRLYSAPLTAEQAAANRAVDEKRFNVGNVFGEDCVFVTAVPEKYADGNSPAYGLTKKSFGDPVALTAPATVSLGEGTRAVCTGWKLYDGATGLPQTESDAESRLACEFTYEKPVRLVWQWKVQYLVTATADAGLTVSPTEQWVDENGEGTFTVSGMTGCPYWTGDAVFGGRHGAQVTVKPTAAGAISVSEGTVLNVPVDVDTIEAALEAAQPGDTVRLAAGVYTNATNDGIFVPPGVALVGQGADSSATVIQAATGTAAASLVTVNGGQVENITFRGARCNGEAGGPPRALVATNGAQVVGCVFTGTSLGTRGNIALIAGEGTLFSRSTIANTTRTGGNAWTSGSSIRVADGAEVSDSFITNNVNCVDKSLSLVMLDTGAKILRTRVAGNTLHNREQYNPCAAGIGIPSTGTGCLVEDCVIEGNAIGSDTASSKLYKGAGGLVVAGAATIRRTVIRNNSSVNAFCGGAYVTGAAMFENCLIAGNKVTAPINSASCCGGLYVANACAVLRHVTVVDNVLEVDQTTHKTHGCYLSGAQAVNCIFFGNGSARQNIVVEGKTGSATYCLAPTLAEFENASNARSGAGCRAGDPLFTAAGAGDYTLTSSSPALDVGEHGRGVAEDLRGVARPKNAGYDLGAYECEYAAVYECSLQPTEQLLGPAGGPVTFEANVTMISSVSAYAWTAADSDGNVLATGTEKTFTPVFPAVLGAYTVSLKVTWNSGHEATAPVPGTVRVVRSLDVAPGDDLVSVLASLTGLSADNPVTVKLAAGTYTAENSGVTGDPDWMYTLEEGVVLKGAGVDATVLDGGRSNRVLRLLAGSKVCDLTVANARCKFYTAAPRGYGLDVSGATVENCVVTNGCAADTAGGWQEHCVCVKDGGTVANSQVCGTTVKEKDYNSQGGVVYISSGTVTNCQIFANKTRDKSGTALTMNGANAMAVDCDIFGNTASGLEYRGCGSGGVAILSGGGKLIGCRVFGNTNGAGAGYYYAGGLCVAGGDALIDRCVISNNVSGFTTSPSSNADAAGVLLFGKCTMRNTLVAGNRMTGGSNGGTIPNSAGVTVASAAAKVENCTIVDNTLDGGCCASAGLRLAAAANVVNCIVWGNGGTPKGGEWMLGNISNVTASVTCTCTAPLVDGEGNIDEDPRLKVKKGYLIKSSSPCVNAGDPTGWTADDVDLLGNPRLRKGSTIDMGCYQATLQGLMLLVK